jgi:DNA repair exonuclease SbcCD ATPase subunit
MGTVNDEVGPVAEELMEERKVIEDQVEALEALLEQSEADEARLKALEGELKSFDASRQKRIKRLVLEAIGRKPKARGPKDWNP